MSADLSNGKKLILPDTLPIDYFPSENEEYMCPNHLKFFEEKLLEWKRNLLKESEETLHHLRDQSLNDPDETDRANRELNVNFEIRTRGRYLKLINKIDNALEKIYHGTYGYCEETGEPIGLKRLNARPVANLCIRAQEEHERLEKDKKILERSRKEEEEFWGDNEN